MVGESRVGGASEEDGTRAGAAKKSISLEFLLLSRCLLEKSLLLTDEWKVEVLCRFSM